MLHVGHTGHLDAKVVHDEAKSDFAPHVSPQTRCVLTLIVAFDGKAFFK
jgi:hypothetical protein